VVVINSREFHRNPFSVLATQKKYICHGTEHGTERSEDGIEVARDSAKHNASGAAYAADE